MTSPLPLLDLGAGQCRWAVNEASDSAGHLFCGEAVAGEGPYCACHAALAVGPGTLSERTAVRVARYQANRESSLPDVVE